MNSLHWFLDPLKNHYFDFEGRATREQYWMFVLVYIVISFILGFILGLFSGFTGSELDNVVNLISLVILLPSLAIAARRLHDVGKSGWWQLLLLIPIIGWIVLIVFTATKGEVGANKYGPDPLGQTGPSSGTPAPVSTVEASSAANVVPPAPDSTTNTN